MGKTTASFVAKTESGLQIKVSKKKINLKTLQLILSNLVSELAENDSDSCEENKEESDSDSSEVEENQSVARNRKRPLEKETDEQATKKIAKKNKLWHCHLCNISYILESNYMRHVNNKHNSLKAKIRGQQSTAKKTALKPRGDRLPRGDLTRCHANDENDSDSSQVYENQNVARNKQQEMSASGSNQATSKPGKRKRLRCKVCGKTYSNQKSLNQHLMCCHASDENDSDSSEENKEESDSDSSEVEENQSVARNRKRPLEKETDEQATNKIAKKDKPWHCRLCNNSYTLESNLKRHINNKHNSLKAKIRGQQSTAKKTALKPGGDRLPRGDLTRCHANDENDSDSSQVDENQNVARNKQQEMSASGSNQATSKPGKRKRLRCKVCGKTYSSQESLNQHLMCCHASDENDSDSSEENKEESDSDSSEVEENQSVARNRKKPLEKETDEQATNKIAEKDKPWHCRLCNNSYTLESNLKRHINNKHNSLKAKIRGQQSSAKKTALKPGGDRLPRGDLTRCHANDENDSDSSQVDENQNVARNKQKEMSASGSNQTTSKPGKRKRLRCKVCGKTYSSQESLNRHLMCCHASDENDSDSSEENKEESDSDSSEVEENQSVARNRKRPLEKETDEQATNKIAEKDKPWHCRLCNNSYTLESNLKRHINNKHNSLKAKIRGQQSSAKKTALKPGGDRLPRGDLTRCHANDENDSDSSQVDENQNVARNKQQEMSASGSNQATSKPGKRKRLRCKVCGKTYSSQEPLNRHLMCCNASDENDTDSSEENKEESDSDSSEVEENQSVARNRKRPLEKETDEQATNKIAEKDKPWHCRLCSNSYTLKGNLKRHINNKHNSLKAKIRGQQSSAKKTALKPGGDRLPRGDLTRCHANDENDSDSSQVDENQNVARNKQQEMSASGSNQATSKPGKRKRLRCKLCGKTYSSQGYLNRHLTRYHANEESEEENNSDSCEVEESQNVVRNKRQVASASGSNQATSKPGIPTDSDFSQTSSKSDTGKLLSDEGPVTVEKNLVRAEHQQSSECKPNHRASKSNEDELFSDHSHEEPSDEDKLTGERAESVTGNTDLVMLVCAECGVASVEMELAIRHAKLHFQPNYTPVTSFCSTCGYSFENQDFEQHSSIHSVATEFITLELDPSEFI